MRAVSRALRAAARARDASTALRTIRSASLGFSSRNSASLELTTEATKPCMPGLPSLVFVWPSNCGSVSFAEMTAVRPSRMSSPSSALSLSLSRPELLRVAVQRAGERGAEAREVRAALVRVDVVREREHRLLIGRVPLQRDLDGAVLLVLALEEDDLVRVRVLVLVDVADEVLDPTLVVEVLVLLVLAALVGDRDVQAAGEERRLAQALLERRVLEGRRLEDLRVRAEGDRRAGLLRGLALHQLALREAAGVLLVPRVAVALDRDVELLRERVDDGHAHAVQTAGDLVAAAVAELAAGVQDGQDDLQRGLVLLLHLRDRDAAPVVDDGDRCCPGGSSPSTVSQWPASASSTELSTTS